MGGAAPLGSEVQKQCAKRLGCIVKQAWGMTELSPCGAITPDEECGDIDTITGKSGLLAPLTEAKIVDSENGEDLPFTSEGELMIRGPQVMKGYYKNEEATKNTIRSDGWMHTGDIAKFDQDGWLIITELKELIKVKGLQVAPSELEDLIRRHPGVNDVAVVGVPDDRAGELPNETSCPLGLTFSMKLSMRAGPKGAAPPVTATTLFKTSALTIGCVAKKLTNGGTRFNHVGL
jgi:4-coumarate--CoA ligase